MILIGIIIGAMMTLVVYSAYILFIAFTLWMAVDAAKQDRFWWVVLIIGIPVIGSAVYYFTEKKHEYAKAPVHHIHTAEADIQHEITPVHHHRRKTDPVEAAEKNIETKEKEEEEKAA